MEIPNLACVAASVLSGVAVFLSPKVSAKILLRSPNYDRDGLLLAIAQEADLELLPTGVEEMVSIRS